MAEAGNHEAGDSTQDERMIVRQADFNRYCDHLARCESIAFDTEFVSEDCYRPDLCLIQVATAGGLAVIDPKGLDRVDRFWEVIVDGEHETVVHAGREEMRFCLFATGRLPRRLFDVQIAAGFVGLEYPAAYRTLVQRLAHRELAKEETRTNWRTRPLTESQVSYALTDVEFLLPIREVLRKRLARLGREAWCEEEIAEWAEGIRRSETIEPWRRVAGSASLSARSLAIVRALWDWREETARRRDCPARRVLRDDLIVELAKRATPNLARIKSLRGLERGDLRRHLDEIAGRIESVLNADRGTWPEPRQTPSSGPPLNLLVQFLQTALSCLCRERRIAPGIVATSQDLKDWVAHRLGLGDRADAASVSLLHGWRRQLVVEPLDRLLRGEWSIGVENPLSDQPLRLVAGGGVTGAADLPAQGLDDLEEFPMASSELGTENIEGEELEGDESEGLEDRV